MVQMCCIDQRRDPFWPCFSIYCRNYINWKCCPSMSDVTQRRKGHIKRKSLMSAAFCLVKQVNSSDISEAGFGYLSLTCLCCARNCAENKVKATNPSAHGFRFALIIVINSSGYAAWQSGAYHCLAALHIWYALQTATAVMPHRYPYMHLHWDFKLYSLAWKCN